MSTDHASGISAPKADPVFLDVKAGMNRDRHLHVSSLGMEDVIWVDGGARNPMVPTLFHAADVDAGFIN